MARAERARRRGRGRSLAPFLAALLALAAVGGGTYLLVADRSSSPKPTEERGAGLPDADRKEYQRLCDMTGREVIEELYESDQLKTFISMNACVRGMPDFAPGTD